MKRPNHQESQQFSSELPSYDFSRLGNPISEDLLSNLNDTGDRITPRELWGINKKDFAGMLTYLLEAVQQFEDELTSKYQSSYESLVKSRSSNGKVVPPLKDILHNIQQLSDSRRKENASHLISEEFGDISQVKIIYDNPEKLEERKSTILELHNLTVKNNLQPFDLGKPDHISLVSQGMKKVRDSLGVSPAQARDIYEKLADYGYLGTLQEINSIKEQLNKLESLNGFNSFMVQLNNMGILYMIYNIIAGKLLEPPSNPVEVMLHAIFALVGTGTILISMKLGRKRMGNAIVEGNQYLVKVPKRYILRKKLEKLYDKDRLIDSANKLLIHTSGVSYSYEDLDSMSTEELKGLVNRLANIRTLQFREFKGGKRPKIEQLQALSDYQLNELVASIRDFDTVQINNQINKTVDVLYMGTLEKEKIEQIKAQLHNEILDNHRLSLPSDIIEVEVDQYKYIKYLDEYIKVLSPTEDSLEKYQQIKNQVLLGNEELEKLRVYVMLMNGQEAQDKLDTFEVKEQIKPLLEELPLTENQRNNILSKIDIFTPDVDTTQSQKSDYDEIPLDLNKLEAFVQQKKKEVVDQPRNQHRQQNQR